MVISRTPTVLMPSHRPNLSCSETNMGRLQKILSDLGTVRLA
jgi:hypothetical protein